MKDNNKKYPYKRKSNFKSVDGKVKKNTATDDALKKLEQGYSVQEIAHPMMVITEMIMNDLWSEYHKTGYDQMPAREWIHKQMAALGAIQHKIERAWQLNKNGKFILDPTKGTGTDWDDEGDN